jgi:hypothetical protein
LAVVRGQDVDELGWQTLRNTKELFDLPEAVLAAPSTMSDPAHS